MNTDERFDKFVVPDGDCLRWIGAVDRAGYGQFKLNGKSVKAHRYSYERCKGKIPVNLQVRHKCHNTRCVNPDHLDVGTAQDNQNDKVKASRQAKGESSNLAKLTKEKVLEIRRLHSLGYTQAKIAGILGSRQTTVSKVVRRDTWKHI